MRRGRIWWIQYREGGRRVRESLGTTNRKLAEELRRLREIEVTSRRFGIALTASGALATSAPASSGSVASAAADANGAAPAAAPAQPFPLLGRRRASVPAPFAAAAPPPAAAGAVAVAALPASPSPTAALPGQPSLADIRAEYSRWSVAHKRPKTILNDTARLGEFFAFVPDKPLREMRTADVERFLTHKATSGKRPATQMRHREILHAFWRWALRQGYVDANVVSAIPRPRIPERDPVFLSLAQVEELLAAVAGTIVEVAIAIAVFAGLRREELCWLTWDDVELDAAQPMLRVRAKTIDGESWQTKTKRDRRVPISARLLAVLLRHRETGRRRGVRWLLPSPLGCRWDPDNLSREIRPVLQSAKLPWNLLQLRHTFGSQLARKGVSLLKIAKLMGNSPAIAARHYINLVPEEMADDVAF
jgi:integrase